MKLSSFALLALSFGWAAAPTAFAAQHPNIVFLLADDMGYGDPTANNSRSRIPTPNIDRIAREGIRFTDAHAPASVCVPSRYGLLTGRYPLRTSLQWRQRAVIPSGESTLASLLKARNYTTAMVGKWHLGFDGGPDYDFDQPLTGGPVDRGFDTYFGIPQSLDIPPYYYIRNRRPIAPPDKQIEANSSEGWTRIQGAFWRAGGVANGFRHEEVLPKFEQEAVSAIENHVRSDPGKPLFLYVALPAPHTPWLPLDRFQGKSRVGMYGDFVLQVDHTVGQILDALDRTQLTDSTLVIFTSDNGPVWYEQDVQRFSHDAVGPLRGMKGDAWEGGHRVPFLARWPGRVQPGSTSDQLLCFTDMMATFAAIVGSELPETATDSHDMLPALLRRDSQPIRDNLVLKQTATVVRQGDWKLITHLGSGGFSDPRRVSPVSGGPEGQLYNLAADIGETYNLWLERPDLVRRLREILHPYRRAED